MLQIPLLQILPRILAPYRLPVILVQKIQSYFLATRFQIIHTLTQKAFHMPLDGKLRLSFGGTQQPTVPPGLGKPSTHSRNKRRKLKRKYATAQPSAQSLRSLRPTTSVKLELNFAPFISDVRPHPGQVCPVL
ncbi:hypothetical protein JB92DRAFT_1228237 [Gautieria morchelliformis]|nr:hypothetical protein JB92DRAFT_1228237 [Gautieria morchelliformis]